MELILSLSRYILPALTVIIILMCIRALLLGRPDETTLAHLVDNTENNNVPLNMWETSIGRSKACDISVKYATVSRFHAVIARRLDSWYIYDINSKAGIRVNGEKINRSAEIKHLDTITFGQVVSYQFVVDDDPIVGLTHRKKREIKKQIKKERKGNKPVPEPPVKPVYTPPIYPEEPEDVFAHLVDNANNNILLNNSETSIGRSEECDIPVKDATVSRFHARIAKQSDGWYIYDTNSKAGIKVNGVKINKSARIKHLDTITIGQAVSFKFVIDNNPAYTSSNHPEEPEEKTKFYRNPNSQDGRPATHSRKGFISSNGRLFLLTGTRFTFGPTSRCNVFVNGDSSEIVFATVDLYDDGTWAISSSAYYTPTYLNDIPVTEPQTLFDGDVIVIGNSTFRYSEKL